MSRLYSSQYSQSRRARTDASQAGIVAALRKIGAEVEPIGLPLDLLVSYAHRTFLIECKTPGKEKRRTAKQQAFLDRWPGELHVCSTPEEAIDAATTGGLAGQAERAVSGGIER